MSMDQNSLVSLVTQLVLEELSRSGGTQASESSESSREPAQPLRKVLICGAPGSACEQNAWTAMHLFKDVHWLVVDWPGYPAQRLIKGLGQVPVTVVNPPELWDDLVRSVQGVVLPFGPIDILAKIAELITDVPPVSAVIAALIQGVPVYVGNDDSERLTRHSARIPRGVISKAQDHTRAVTGMGIVLDTPNQIVANFSGGIATLASSPCGGRDVVTNEDVMAAMQAGKNVLDVAPGSIITSLARETAERFEIEVRFR